MPQYLGQEVSDEFTAMIVRVYKQQYEATHPEHQLPAEDDATILADLEHYQVTGGPHASVLGRYMGNPTEETARQYNLEPAAIKMGGSWKKKAERKSAKKEQGEEQPEPEQPQADEQ